MRTFSVLEQKVTLSDGAIIEFGNDPNDYSVCAFSILRTDGSRDWVNFGRNGPITTQGNNPAAGSDTDTEANIAIEGGPSTSQEVASSS